MSDTELTRVRAERDALRSDMRIMWRVVYVLSGIIGALLGVIAL